VESLNEASAALVERVLIFVLDVGLTLAPGVGLVSWLADSCPIRFWDSCSHRVIPSASEVLGGLTAALLAPLEGVPMFVLDMALTPVTEVSFAKGLAADSC